MPEPSALPNLQRSRWWRSDAWLGALVLLGVMALSFLLNGLERRLYDLASVRSERLPNKRIAIIAIDDQSIANIGRWPWPRDVHAQLIEQLTVTGAKSIGHTAFFFEPQTARGIDKLRELRELRGLTDPQSPSAASLPDLGDVSRQQLLGFIGDAERALDADAMLAASLQRAARVVLPSVFTLGTTPGRADRPLPPFALRSALPDAPAMGVPAAQSQQPIAAIGEAARAVAHLNLLPDRDGAVRQEALLVSFDGHAVPSMALMLAAQSLNLGPADLRGVPGLGVQLVWCSALSGTHKPMDSGSGQGANHSDTGRYRADLQRSHGPEDAVLCSR